MMQEFMFYIKLGLHHVLDFSAYDHILFLAALAVPFTFKNWKKVVLLATIFTLTHCFSLYLAAYDIVTMNVGLIEFLIPVTIFATALFNINYVKADRQHRTTSLHVFATAFFGLIHGFGFSNYFKMLIAEEEDKLTPLLGFATGIELAQVSIVVTVLILGYVFQHLLKVRYAVVVISLSIIIILITIPMLIATFPW